MAILKRRTDPIKVITALDACWADVPPRLADRYFTDRKLEDVADAIAKSAHAPTYFTLSPLLAKHDHLMRLDMTPDVQREIVRRHLIAVEGLDLRWEDVDGRRVPTTESLESLPLETVAELAQVVVQAQSKSGGELDFFSQPGIWPEARRAIGLANLRAGRRMDAEDASG